MDIILHVGAHRTATTSFQHYLRDQRANFAAGGTVIWEPRQLRGKIFAGLHPKGGRGAGTSQARAAARVKMRMSQLEASTAKRLFVSDENMIGAPRACFKSGSLYPEIGARMARVNAAFDGMISRVVLSIRALDLWWASVAAYAVARGQSVPGHACMGQIAQNPRSWRDVITDLACAVPSAELLVLPFEHFASQPSRLAAQALGCNVPKSADAWLHRSPDLGSLRQTLEERGHVSELPAGEGRWMPFNAQQASALREAYADDMMWLVSGADGIATLTEDLTRANAGKTTLPDDMRGRSDERRGQGHIRRMA